MLFITFRNNINSDSVGESTHTKLDKPSPNINTDFDPVEYIIGVLSTSPRMTLDRWGMNYNQDDISIFTEFEPFANWYYSTQGEKLGDEIATQTIKRQKLRSLSSKFETSWLRNLKKAV